MTELTGLTKMKKNRARTLAMAAVFLLALLAGCTESDDGDYRGEALLGADALATLTGVSAIDEGQGFHGVDYKADYALDELMVRGVENQEALDAFLSDRLLNGLPFHSDTLRLACSTFAAAKPDGDYIQGRNMDLAGAQSFIVRTRPENGYESLSMVTGLPLGYIGRLPDSPVGRLLLLTAPYFPTDGINERGLSVALLLLQDAPVSQRTGKVPVTTLLAIRLMLDRAATVDEAEALLATYDMHSIYNASYHFHVADAEGGSAVIECVDGGMRVVRSEGYGQVAANFYLSPEKIDLLDDGKDRLATLQAALDEGGGVVSQEKAWRMLDSVKAVHDYDPLTDIDFNTAYSIVYNNTKRTMDVCVGMNFDVVHRFKVGENF